MKLTILRGLPACGKSTKAAELIRASGNMVRLNKDLARTMLHFDKFSGRNEDLTHFSMTTLATALLAKTNVIVDDTNLNPRVFEGWKQVSAEAGAKVEVIDMTDVPADECVRRDAVREKSVGYTVIRNMALRYGLQSFPPGGVVLCDLDGTIADISHRLPFVRKPEGEKKDWGSFFAAIPQDTVREDVRAKIEEHRAAGRTIVFLSARPDTYQPQTVEWLSRHGLDHYTLIMRPGGDKRDDTAVKQDMLDRYFRDRSAIHVILDDRPKVVRLWQSLGLPVDDVGCGVEF